MWVYKQIQDRKFPDLRRITTITTPQQNVTENAKRYSPDKRRQHSSLNGTP